MTGGSILAVIFITILRLMRVDVYRMIKGHEYLSPLGGHQPIVATGALFDMHCLRSDGRQAETLKQLPLWRSAQGRHPLISTIDRPFCGGGEQAIERHRPVLLGMGDQATELDVSSQCRSGRDMMLRQCSPFEGCGCYSQSCNELITLVQQEVRAA